MKAMGKSDSSDKWIFTEKWKRKLVEEICRYLNLFQGIKLAGFTIMSNHGHFIFAIENNFKLSRKEVAENYEKCYGKRLHGNSKMCFQLAEELSDLSKLMQRFAREFACKFNKAKKKQLKRTGHLWSENFHSTLINAPNELLRCWMYVMFNPVKASITSTPRKYEHNSLNSPVEGMRAMCLQNLFEAYKNLSGQEELTLKEFRLMLEAMIDEELERRQLMEQAKLTEYLERQKVYELARVIGSKEYCSKLCLAHNQKPHLHHHGSGDIHWT